jgi:hypothetical protein
MILMINFIQSYHNTNIIENIINKLKICVLLIGILCRALRSGRIAI